MSHSDRILLLVTLALRDAHALPPATRADLFQAAGDVLKTAALVDGPAELNERAEHALEIAFQIRHSEEAQLNFLQRLQEVRPQP